jgi:predicted nucleotidyltransferase component of viral defense system
MTLDANKHRNIMLQILKDIYADMTIGPVLGFKGGTAAYLFYDLNRFSVDLDFDLLDQSKEDYVFEKIEAILEKYGIFRDKQKKRHTLFFMISYEESLQNVKVEINRRETISKYETRTLFGISMLVMVKEDMFANKLLAMVDRIGRTNRDIFDVWFFFKNNWDFNDEIIEKRFGMPIADFLQKAINVLDAMNDNNILAGLGELLDVKQKAWVKEHLKNDTLFLLRLALDNETRKKDAL